MTRLEEGDQVRHSEHGEGVVLWIDPEFREPLVRVKFPAGPVVFWVEPEALVRLPQDVAP